MKYSKIPAAQTVVSLCKSKGIKNIVISPGSRNAPLTLGFTEDDFFNCFSIVDERCAAFFALGIVQQIEAPVVVLCTSGSALLNYYPAVSEAFYSDLPLVVISADRPSHKIDIGDGQTIRQEGVFDNHIHYSANLRLDQPNSSKQDEVQVHNENQVNLALNKAVSQHGPVHINVPFEEPLYDIVDQPSVEALVVGEEREEAAMGTEIQDFAKLWNSAKRKMILVGVHAPNKVEKKFLEELASDPSVLVFTETTSNIHHPHFFPSIDSIIAPIEKSDKSEELFSELQPEVLLTFGGMIVSKKIKAFLRTFKPQYHAHVNPYKANDTFFALSHPFKKGMNSFLKIFLEHAKPVESGYFKRWDRIRRYGHEKRENYLKKIPFCDFSVFDRVQTRIPRGYQVQLANSSTVRYSQLFDMHPSLEVFSNRGTSGIDGSTSTAIGASLYHKEPTLLITGDLSFFYDSNALWNDHIRNDFRIIVINNRGGGIFRILPGKEDSKRFETFFETVQNLEISKLCELYGIEHTMVNDSESLNRALSTFYKVSERPKLLEICTPRDLNDKILLAYFDFLS